MQFTNPIWLWGFLGLVVPVAIHLLSRREGRTIKFGSIRHLEDSATTQFKHVRLNQYLLLAIRCLVIALLTLTIAGPHFLDIKTREKWLLLEPGLKLNPQMKSLTDSLTADGFKTKWFYPDFPDEAVDVDTTALQDYWSLTEVVSKLPLETVVVISHSNMAGFRGKQLSLPTHVHWLTQEKPSREFVLSAMHLTPDTMWVRNGFTDGFQTSFKNERITNTGQAIDVEGELRQPDTISVSVAYDMHFDHDKNILTAALMTLDEVLPVKLLVRQIPTDSFRHDNVDWTIWLSQKPMPKLTTHAIRYDSAVAEESIIVADTSYGPHERWTITKRLTKESVLKANFGVLLGLTLTRNEKLTERLRRLDARVMPEKLRWKSNTDLAAFVQDSLPPSANEGILVVILAAAVMFERWLAYKRLQ